MTFTMASVPAHVMVRQVGDETVILNLETGTYFGLNPIGAQYWQLLSAGKPFADICAALLQDYDVPYEEIRRDLGRLTDELVSHGLIECQP